VIQWRSAHPAAQLEDRGCALLGLDLAHPQAPGVLPLFRALKLTGPVNLATGPRSLTAHLLTPRGPVALQRSPSPSAAASPRWPPAPP
jgi:hypothetical protein